jgi:hypothetical protein
MAEATNIESIFRWKFHVPRIGSQEVREILCVFSVSTIKIGAFIDNRFNKEIRIQNDEV